MRHSAPKNEGCSVRHLSLAASGTSFMRKVMPTHDPSFTPSMILNRYQQNGIGLDASLLATFIALPMPRCSPMRRGREASRRGKTT